MTWEKTTEKQRPILLKLGTQEDTLYEKLWRSSVAQIRVWDRTGTPMRIVNSSMES
jgi:hypothetical protein